MSAEDTPVSTTTRKDAIRHYKDHPPARGAFALRNRVTGHAWVGASPNLDAARNGAFFMLRLGQHRDRALQAEWHAHGEPAFAFEVLETLAADAAPFSVADELKGMKARWAARLAAPVLLP